MQGKLTMTPYEYQTYSHFEVMVIIFAKIVLSLTYCKNVQILLFDGY